MRQNTGWLAAIGVAVAALFGFYALPSRNAPGAAGTVAPQKEALPRERASPKLEDPCWEIEKRILPFLPANKIFAPGECYQSGKAEEWTSKEKKNSPEFQFLIATLPNPVHTHFSLQFDRLADALQQAVQDQGFIYDSSWFPWVEQPRQYGALADQDKANKRHYLRENQPGLMVFRNSLPRCLPEECNPNSRADSDRCCAGLPYQRVLLIFIAAEDPTAGIDSEQFDNAIGWIKALRPHGTGHSLRVLSPVFSGSFPSLAHALTTGKAQEYIATNQRSVECAHGSNQLPKVVVFSGAASSKQGIDWFSSFLAGKKLGRFATFQESDDLVINRYCRLLDRQVYDTGRLAIISEGETAYGAIAAEASRERTNPAPQRNPDAALFECVQKVKGETRGPLYLSYPRDIASLRSAYAKQSPAGGEQWAQQGASGLPENLSESDAGERDTIHRYGGEQTPLSQESTLFEVVNLLKEHRIEFILLRSSNVLDQIFLTYFFARTYPDARVVILNSDLMFLRSTATQGFRGTMTLSTYPLLAWQQDWTYYQTPESPQTHRAFADANSEGLYVASRFLIHFADSDLSSPLCLGPPGACGPSAPPNSPVLLQDYGPPTWLLKDPPTPTHPPTWLSVLGTSQVWPVAVVDEELVLRRPEQLRAANCSTGSVLPTAWTGAVKHAGEFHLPLSIRVCFILVLLWCVLHLCCCWSASQTATPGCRAYFAPVPGLQHDLLIFFGCMLIALLAIVLSSLTSTTSDTSVPFTHYGQMIVFYSVMVGLSLFALLGNYRVALRGRRENKRSPNEKTKRDDHQAQNDERLKSEQEEQQAKEMQARETRGAEAKSETRTVQQHEKGWFEKLRQKVDHRVTKTVAWIQYRLRRRVILGGVLFALLTAALKVIFYVNVTAKPTRAGDVFTIWRSVNLFSGVSPLTPLLLLIVGAYGWFWFTLRGLALFNRDRPKLPKAKDLDERLPMFSWDWTGNPIEQAAKPFDVVYVVMLAGFLVGLLVIFKFFAYIYDFAVRSLGPVSYSQLYSYWLCGCIAFILADAFQILRIWSRLRKLLLNLDRLPLRRTLYALREFSWGTVWKMSGSVFEQRYKLLSRQMESFRHLKNELDRLIKENATKDSTTEEDLGIPPSVDDIFMAQLEDCERSQAKFVEWYLNSYQDSGITNLGPVGRCQDELTKTAGAVCKKILMPRWRKERQSLIQDLAQPQSEGTTAEKRELSFSSIPEFQRQAEEFLVLPYLGFIQNVLGRMRTIAIGMLWLFITATISVASYPFDPRPLLGGIFLSVFVLVGTIIVYVYAGMHRDTTLSHITNTTPGELGWAFWIRLAAIGIGPLLAVLTALFPGTADFVTSWLQPSVQAIK